jgi:hypothetical protein
MENICCELNSLMRNLEQIASRAVNSLTTNGSESDLPSSSGNVLGDLGSAFNVGVVVVIFVIVLLLLQRPKKKAAACRIA